MFASILKICNSQKFNTKRDKSISFSKSGHNMLVTKYRVELATTTVCTYNIRFTLSYIFTGIFSIS